jgi:hypothetical protein
LTCLAPTPTGSRTVWRLFQYAIKLPFGAVPHRSRNIVGRRVNSKVEALFVDVPAEEYVATNKQPGLQPYDWYKQHVVVGAREANLPEDYVRKIEAVIAVNGPDLTRTERELRAYATM